MDIKEIYNEVHSIVPDIEKVIKSLMHCVNHINHRFDYSDGYISMRAITDIGMINYYSTKTDLTHSIGTYGINSTDILLAQSTKDYSKWYVQSQKILGTNEHISTDKFLNLSKDEYFNYLLCTSEINLKYIIGCAIILKKFNFDVPNVIALDAERINSLGLHSLACALDNQTKRLLNENIFSEDI